MGRFVTSVAFCLCVAFSAAPKAIGQTYIVIDLGPMPQNQSIGKGINRCGQVAGFYAPERQAPPNTAFLYSDGKTLSLGDLPGGGESAALAVNDLGQVAGVAQTADGYDHAFVYSQGVMKDLGTFAGGSVSEGDGINDSGQVSGDGDLADGLFHAFLYTDGAFTDLGTLPGGSESIGGGINRHGHVTGYSYTGAVGGPFHAFLYRDGQMQDLGTLPGTTLSLGSGINDFDEITGSSGDADGSTTAILYRDGKMINLGTLPGEGSSLGIGINNHGDVVGAVDATDNPFYVGSYAFIYSHGKMQNLNDLIPSNSGWLLQSGASINDRGQIAGTGLVNTYFTHAFLLTPVVEKPDANQQQDAIAQDADHDGDHRKSDDGCGDRQ